MILCPVSQLSFPPPLSLSLSLSLYIYIYIYIYIYLLLLIIINIITYFYYYNFPSYSQFSGGALKCNLYHTDALYDFPRAWRLEHALNGLSALKPELTGIKSLRRFVSMSLPLPLPRLLPMFLQVLLCAFRRLIGVG